MILDDYFCSKIAVFGACGDCFKELFLVVVVIEVSEPFFFFQGQKKTIKPSKGAQKQLQTKLKQLQIKPFKATQNRLQIKQKPSQQHKNGYR